MSKRLQVILEDEEMREIQRVAKRNHVTVAEWVRSTLREARSKQPAADSRRKLESLRAATRHAFPTGDIDQMLAEIERGFLGGGE